MKKIFTCLMMVTIISVSAQTLSNPGFENWSTVSVYSTDTVPNNWYGMYCNTVHQTTDAYQGTYASRVQGYFMCGISQGILINGQQPAGFGDIIKGGTPFTAKPSVIKGFYKYTDVVGNDSAEVTIILKKFNTSTMNYDTVGIGIQPLAPVSSYSLFTVNMNYPLPSLTPDSIIIMFNSSKYLTWDPITYALPNLYVDRILLDQSISTGISESTNSVLESSVYPNPFSDNSTLLIKGDITSLTNPVINIFDSAGKKVMSQKLTQNNVSISGLSQGSYIYAISSSEKILSKGKIIVQ
jgi:hypothetical protein